MFGNRVSCSTRGRGTVMLWACNVLLTESNVYKFPVLHGGDCSHCGLLGCHITQTCVMVSNPEDHKLTNLHYVLLYVIFYHNSPQIHPKMGNETVLTVELTFEQIPSVDDDWLTVIN
jgi:hypothetical protein